MIDVKAIETIYGIIKAELLFYNNIFFDLNTIGFKINIYYPFVTNKVIDDKKINMAWHVSNLKFSHGRKNIVTRMAKWLKKSYEILFEDRFGNIKIYIVNIHEYLYMTLDFSAPGEVKITIINYIEETAKDFTKNGDTFKTYANLASGHLFRIRYNAIILKKTQDNIYHIFLPRLFFPPREQGWKSVPQ